MPRVCIDAAVINDKGRIRGNNEDSFLFNGQHMPLAQMDAGAALQQQFDTARQVYAVCDGMGGEAAGEEASFQSVEALGKLAQTSRSITPEQLRQDVAEISDQVYDAAKAKQRRSGATLAMLWIEQAQACLVNVGDSRIYRLREGAFTQLTVDQTEVQRMIALGVLTPEEARKHPKRHVISQYLGMPNEEVRVAPEVTGPFELQPGDRFLLCSDGLTDMVQDEEIGRMLSAAGSPAEGASALVRAALEAGGRDNVTAMVLMVQEAGAAPAGSRKAGLVAGGVLGAAFLYVMADALYRLYSFLQ